MHNIQTFNVGDVLVYVRQLKEVLGIIKSCFKGFFYLFLKQVICENLNIFTTVMQCFLSPQNCDMIVLDLYGYDVIGVNSLLMWWHNCKHFTFVML